MDRSDSERALSYMLTPADPEVDGAPVVVLLHGRGSDENDLQGLRQLLPIAWTLVTPRAPHGGLHWGYGPGWAWYRYVRDDELVVETLEHSLHALDAFLDGLPEILGRAPGPVVIGGFSQGGTTSMAYALTRTGRVAAALNFSGFLPSHIDPAVAAEPPAIFWGHGVDDPNIPHLLAVSGRARLGAAAVPLTTADYPIGHWIVPEEVEAAVHMVKGALAGGRVG